MAHVFRDAHGVPHVRGRDVLDLARGQGAALAHDRAWQLEWLRRRATGTTAELVGAGGEAWDRFAVRLRIADTGRRALDALSPESRAFVAAYVEGVNAGLAATSRPPELTALGRDAQPWEEWTPLATFHAQQVMFADIGSLLWERTAREVLGDDAALLSHEGPLPAGSNAWAVGGDRTATGLPLVGGDPHRTFESPGVYHQVRLACDDPDDDLDVVGFAFAGVPGVQHFAHAGEVAWAITNAMADYQDLDDVGPDHDGPTVLPGVGFRGPSTELGDLGFEALLPLLRARTVDDVDAALDHWVEPVNNVVIADVRGTVRYRWAGRVPTRDASGAWTGWVTDDHRVDVGPDGQVVTANERRGPESAEIGHEFAPPFRAQRIRALLDGRTGLTVDDFAAIHADDRLGAVDALRALAPARFAGWDGRMAAGSADAAAYAVWRTALVRRVAALGVFDGLRDRSPDPLVAPWFDVTTYVALALPTLAAADRPFGIDLAEQARLAEADLDAAEAAGEVPATWGATHVFDFLHAFDLAPHLQAPAVPAVPVGGDLDCVRCVASLPGVTDVAYRGSVARYVWDLSDRTASGWAVPMGASGVAGDPHHVDQLPLWAEARLAPVVTDWERLVGDDAVDAVLHALEES